MFVFHVNVHLLLSIMVVILASGCSANGTISLPDDFYFMIDIRSSEPGIPRNINIRINEEGAGKFEYYETGGVIQYDQDNVVTYDPNQVVKRGEFELSEAELGQLWRAIKENGFFELADDYEMALGHSYAFILVQADGGIHIVDNIGMDVPEVRAIVDATQALLPAQVDVEYGEGYIPP